MRAERNALLRYSGCLQFSLHGGHMDRDAFAESLTKEGYPDAVVVAREANTAMDLHAHPFEAKALIIEGEMHIRVGDEERLYRVGDVFHLAANEPHSERYGAHGVKYLVGRKS
jgi:quercetin dioxygenase-like cupin family protein